MSGGLAGIDGHDDGLAALRQQLGAKLPPRLIGLAIAADGRPVGLDLPGLDERGASEAWRRELGKGPYYLRFLDRGGEPPLAWVQRATRLGEVWVDCAVDGVDGALDLLVAGASRLVLWGGDAELLEAVGDSAVVGHDGTRPLADAIAAAQGHHAPILATAPADGDDPGLYQAPPPPWSGRFDVLHVGKPLEDDDE